MKNKTLTIILIVLMALAASVPYWKDAFYQSENNDFPYTAIIFWSALIAFVCSGAFLLIRVKRISDKVWMLLLAVIPLSGIFLSRNFGGASGKIENKLVGIFSEPVMWLLIATLVGHLVLSAYNRNKPRMNQKSNMAL